MFSREGDVKLHEEPLPDSDIELQTMEGDMQTKSTV